MKLDQNKSTRVRRSCELLLAEVVFTKLAYYEEISATVAFVSNKTVEHLDNRHQKVSKSTWTRTETLAILHGNDEWSENEDLSDERDWIDFSFLATGNNHSFNEVPDDISTPAHIIASFQSDIV